MHDSTALSLKLRARRDLPPVGLRRPIREAAGVTQEDVAREVQRDRATVSRWERGLRQPRGADLIRYVEVLRRLKAAN